MTNEIPPNNGKPGSNVVSFADKLAAKKDKVLEPITIDPAIFKTKQEDRVRRVVESMKQFGKVIPFSGEKKVTVDAKVEEKPRPIGIPDSVSMEFDLKFGKEAGLGGSFLDIYIESIKKVPLQEEVAEQIRRYSDWSKIELLEFANNPDKVDEFKKHPETVVAIHHLVIRKYMNA